MNETVARIRAELFTHEDRAYRAFNIKCNPEAEHSIGVRIPILRQIASNLIRGDFRAYLSAASKEYFEERLLEGILIASAPLDETERLCYLRNFVSNISDWCVCDTTCSSFHQTLPGQISPAKIWDFILQYQKSTAEFELRFMLVMMLNHFINDTYLAQIFQVLDNLGELPHYASMAAAWLLAEIIIKERNAAFSYLETSKLPKATFNKALQKACESYRIAPADKKLLRAMKRH